MSQPPSASELKRERENIENRLAHRPNVQKLFGMLWANGDRPLARKDILKKFPSTVSGDNYVWQLISDLREELQRIRETRKNDIPFHFEVVNHRRHGYQLIVRANSGTKMVSPIPATGPVGKLESGVARGQSTATKPHDVTSPGPSETLRAMLCAGAKEFAPLEPEEPVDHYVGRETEKQELLQVLSARDGFPVALIHGMPGLGKTQLALTVAAAARSLFPDGRLLVNLQTVAGIRCSPKDALARCIRAIKGYTTELPKEQPALAEVYRIALAEKRILVIADNATHADHVVALIPPGGCALLVTAREKLPLPEATQFVRPDVLSPKDAGRLLKGICHRITSEVAERIGTLCDYLPLAIRVAGGQLATTDNLEPRTYLGSLFVERLRLEESGRVAPGAEAAFNVSYRRLPRNAAAVFRSLGVFSGTFDAGAEATCCDDIKAKILADLVRRGLVLHSRHIKRYWLHDLIRVFALEKLRNAGNQEFKCRRRHADHFALVLQLADQLSCAKATTGRLVVGLLETERSNLLSAWRWLEAQKCRRSEDVARYSRFAMLARTLAAMNDAASDQLDLSRLYLNASTPIDQRPYWR